MDTKHDIDTSTPVTIWENELTEWNHMSVSCWTYTASIWGVGAIKTCRERVIA
jgi:hypothetical protein